MSIFSDLAGVFAELELTVPVQCGTVSTRAFFDRAGAIRKAGGGASVQIEQDTLYILPGSLDPELAPDVRVRVGSLGALTADAGIVYYVVDSPQSEDDGLVQSFHVAGGAE